MTARVIRSARDLVRWMATAEARWGRASAVALAGLALGRAMMGDRWPGDEVMARLGGVDVGDVAVPAIDGAGVLAELGREDGAGIDPITRAYEAFLRRHDAGGRRRRGAYHTPAALAAFMVRSADEALRLELGMAGGLADLRCGRVLDPAAGTGTFLVEVVRVVRAHFSGCYGDRGGWRAFVRERLLPRMLGIELSEGAAGLARLRLAMALAGTGCELNGDEAMPVRAGDALDEASFAPATVVVGNPPYAVRSANLSPARRALVEAYRRVDGQRVRERSALRLEMHLQDDYVKFFRLAERAVEAAGEGVAALVTPSSYLDAPTLRGMRWSLTRTFGGGVRVLDLGGSRRRGGEGAVRDENVFGIGQGVAVFVGVRRRPAGGEDAGGQECPPAADRNVCPTDQVWHGALHGPRQDKLAALASGATIRGLCAATVDPAPPHCHLAPRGPAGDAGYASWTSLAELFVERTSGIVTAHDGLAIDFDEAELRRRAAVLRDGAIGDEEARALLGGVRDNAGWKLAEARRRLREEGAEADGRCRAIAYRPMDVRRIHYHPAVVWCDRRRVMRHLLGGQNLALCTVRQLAGGPWRHALVARDVVDDGYVSNRTRERTYAMPLYLIDGDGRRRANLSEAVVGRWAEGLGMGWVEEGAGDLVTTFGPEDLLAYVYAALHAPGYRERNAGELAVDFARVPPPGRETVAALCAIGRRLMGAHLLEVAGADVTLRGAGAVVRRGYPVFRDDERVLINGGAWLAGVPREAWGVMIGSYRPCEKWLKDRRGRELGPGDVETYGRVVAACAATAELAASIDRLML